MKLRKILCLLVICSFCTGMPFAAEAANGDNLVQNGGFESNTGGLAYWSLPGAASLNKDAQYVRSGNASVKISTGSYNYPHVQQTVTTALVGGAEYTASMWLYAMNINTYMHFRIYCIDKDGNYIGDIWGEERYTAATGLWDEFKSSFRVPKGTVKVIFCLRMGGTGTVYVDDISCVFTQGPDLFYDYSNDGTFYYSNRTKPGNMTAMVDTEAYPELIGKSVRFAFNDEDKVLKEENVTIPENGEVSFSFPMYLLSEKQKPYTVSCTYSETGKEDKVVSHTVYKFDRPTRIDDEGFFRDENNAIFTPHFMYGVGLEDLDDLKAAGINCIQGYPAQNWLDALHERGMKCLVVLYGSGYMAGSDVRIGTAVSYVKTFKNHPAVLGWLIHDEPDPEEKDLGELVTAYTRIREIDPDHPIVITALANYDVLHQYTDVIIQDSYPYNNTRFTTYPYERNVKAIAESDGRPVYYLMQTFEHQNSFPKPQEVRNMQYASLWAGVKGIGYYKYRGSKADGTWLSETELWEPLKAFGQKEQDTAYDMFVFDKYEKLQDAETAEYQFGVWKKPDGYYLLLRNKKYNESISATIPVEGMHQGWKISAVGGTPLLARAREGAASVSAEKGDVVLLEFTPKPKEISLVGTDANRSFQALRGTATDANFGEKNDGTLFLTSQTELKNPRIYYTFPENSAPMTGKNYVLRFLYKPTAEGNEPIVFIGKNNAYQDRYQTLSGDAFVKTATVDGATLYTAYFTMPAVDESQNVTLMLASYNGSSDGVYDCFSLTEDAEYISFTDGEGNPVSDIQPGIHLKFFMHYLAEHTLEDGETMRAILAVYRKTDGKKELIVTKILQTDIYKGKSVLDGSGNVLYYCSVCDWEGELEVPSGTGTLTYKIFYWNETMGSLKKALTKQ